MMGDETMHQADNTMAEAILRDELARETRALDSVVPVLRHLLASEGHRLVSDAILARVRGMLSDLASQLIATDAGRDPALRVTDQTRGSERDALADALAGDPALLGFCHAIAAESHLAERLHQQHGIDPVLSPLLQELIASETPSIAELAMNALAAQSRFIQAQRRMELPLVELPAELFHSVIAGPPGKRAAARLQQAYDEAASRLGLLARLVSAMRRGAVAALSLEHAGSALFASALGVSAQVPRAHAIVACLEGQGVRLAFALRAAGLEPLAIERQFLLVDPASRLPRDLASISAERARQLLGASAG